MSRRNVEDLVMNRVTHHAYLKQNRFLLWRACRDFGVERERVGKGLIGRQTEK